MPDNISIVLRRFNDSSRLVYYKQVATDAKYWDHLWSRQAVAALYDRNDLPRPIRKIFRKYVATGSRVLEAGCGLAVFTVVARKLGYQADGVDYAPEVVRRLCDRFPEIPFFTADVRDLKMFAEQTYDAVYLPGVCEHFEEGPEAILREMNRILKNGGMLFSSTPCYNSLRRFLSRIGVFRKPAVGTFYQYAFTENEMTAILERQGFKVHQVVHYGALKTLIDHIPGLDTCIPAPFRKPIAVLLDSIWGIRSWGHSCIWIAERRDW